MAFHMSGLPVVAAAATELWPSVGNSLLVPWVGATRPSRPSRTSKTSSSAATAASTRTSPALPEFLRHADIDLSQPILHLGSRSTTSPAMTPRSLDMANPLFRRSFSTLMSRPLGTPYAMRSMSTYQPSRPPSLPSAPIVLRHLQQRGFGSGNVSRSVLASREAAANRNPNSASAQNSFYQALLKANMPAIIVERYKSGRFAANEATEEVYGKALGMINGTSSHTSQTNMATSPGDLSPTEAQAVGQAIGAVRGGGTIGLSAKGAGKNGVIHVVVDESRGSVIFRWIRFLAWFIIITYMSLVILTMVMELMSTMRRPGGKTDFTEVKPEQQKARFTDVHGCDDAKEEVQDIVDFLRNPERYNALGGKMPKGVLLVGPPGTGKTLLARAVAGEAGVPFFFVSGSEFDEVYVGVGAKRVRELFAAAKAKSPSIIFIDELDAVGGRRMSKEASYHRQTLNQLLTEMDGFDQTSSVIIIGATNFPESLDDALMRPGRFDRHVTVSLPDVRGRIDILKHHARKVKASADVNFQAIAARTSGLSGADLENIVNLAAVHASKVKAQAVAQAHFEWAKDKVIMGAEKKTMVITQKEKEMTAYHEAGHALVAYYSSSGTELYKVTILPRGQSLGHTAFLPEMDRHSMSLKDHLDSIDRAMGGKAAEEIVYGNDMVTSGVSADLDGATRIAWAMVGQLGMSEKLGPVEYMRKYNQLSSETRAMVESEVKSVLDTSYHRARALLVSRRKELDLLAKALVEYETLDKAEVEKVIRGEKLKDRISVPPGPMTVPKPPTDPVSGAGLPLPPIPGASDEGENPPPPAPPAAAREKGGEGR